MKSSKQIMLLAILLVVVVVLSALVKVYKSPKPVEDDHKADLMYVLKPLAAKAKVGEKVFVEVYLGGADSPKVSAYDVKIYYDTDKLKLVKSSPGSFFEKYMIVKWDQDSAWFALAKMPNSGQKEANSTSPLVTLEFSAESKGTAMISTQPSSVYLSKTGGSVPQKGVTEIIVN